MLQALRRPIPNRLLVAWAGAATAAVALYCLAYTYYAGSPETLGESLSWAFANVLPWLLAIEAGKRASGWRAAAAALIAATGVSVILGYVLAASADGAAFEIVRRLPPLAFSAAIVAVLRSGVGSSAATDEIPLLPAQIDWVQAAGNYIELRAGDRTIVHRLPIGEAERSLAAHGFVRIHRSTLVRRDRIARVRPQDVVLEDGTHLRVGKRYRSQLDS
ncbi:MAG: LytTR family DNA-binding domain-containing protein [Sphingomicrobium sp.]